MSDNKTKTATKKAAAPKKAEAKKDAKAVNANYSGSTKKCKIKCIKSYGKMVKDTVYTVSENTADALIDKKVAAKA
jgi:hypothetical protein